MKFLTYFILFFSLNLYAKTFFVKIGGMSCESCAEKISKKFLEDKSVKKASISLKDDLLELDLDEQSKLNEDKIKATIEELGYKFNGLK